MINREETLKQTIVLAIYFMLTYTTYLSFSCIITYIAEHDDGQYDYAPLVALVVNYSVYFVTLIFSSGITDYKKQFQISAICHLINYAVYIPGFTDDWGLIAGIVGALFGGYGAAIYWVSQGGYLIKLFRTYHIPENQEGKYFGIANGIVYGSSLFGALITTFGLGLFGTQIYFIILTVLSLVSWAVCAFFLDGLQTNRKQQSLVTQNPTSIASIAQHLVGVDPVQVQTRWQLIKMIFWNTLLYYPKMYYLWLPIIFDGFISGFISTYLNKILPESLRTDLNVGFMLMLEGFGCILGAVTSATLSDRFSVLNIGKVGMMIILLSCALTYLNELLNFEGLEFPFFVAFVWGFLINYITSLESVSCAKINNGYLYSFSIVKQIQALAFIAFQIYLILGNNTIDLIGFLIVLSALSLLAVGILFQFEARRKRVRVEIE